MNYSVDYEPEALADLTRLSQEVQDRVVKKINWLAENFGFCLKIDNLRKPMNPMSVKTVIKSIQALSPEEQLVLFDRLGQLGMEKQVRENVKPISNPSDDPWVKYAGMFKDDPDFDDFLAEMEAYRREIDAELVSGAATL